MRCPQCQAENPDQARFCLECGYQIGARVTLPTTPPSPSSSTDAILAGALRRLIPHEYADRLRATRGKVGQERRLVTILFCDVKGSTAMAEELDPEDVMDIMNGAFEVLIPPIYRHGGTLARLMGDAILAFFGAPLSHEDDAARAIHAALEIVVGVRDYAARLERERGIAGLGVRVGINTGLVVVGEVGTDLRVEYTAMGDAINTAARLEQNAPVGGILISHETYQQVRGLFEVQAPERIMVKGKAEPVRVFRVLRARPRGFRMATRGVEGVRTRMVGREVELKRLQDAFYRTVEKAECQVIAVVGEAGVGKTRLLSEWESWLDELPASIAPSASRFHARANAELQGVPYGLLRDLFVLRLDMQDSDPAQAARDKLEVGIGRVLGSDEQGRMKAHLIGQLLGFDFGASPHVRAVGEDARQLRDRALIYLEELLAGAARGGTAVVLFEDIHWADDSSLDAITRLAALARQGLLIVCLARPALFERRPDWGEGHSFHDRLDLQPLSVRDTRRLVGEILHRLGQVPVALCDAVVSASEGNPLYVEELIKVLIEQGVISTSIEGRPGRWGVDESRLAGLRVPPTLTAVLQARLDGLPLQERGVLQQAAAVGHTFWDRVVMRIAERSGDAWGEGEVPGLLSALSGRELVARHETSTFAGSQEYVFKHVALREVAYECILKKVRRGYHSLVADWLIEQSGQRASEYTGLIAEHLELAGRAEEALGYLKEAGEQAAARFAHAEAVDYYTRAVALLDHAGWEPRRVAEERFGLLLRRELALDFLGRRAEQAVDLAAFTALASEPAEEGREAAQRRAKVALRQADYHNSLGDYRAALASAQEAAAWAERAGDPASAVQGLILCGVALWMPGQLGEARGLFERALALARERGDRAAEARALHCLGSVAPDSKTAVDYLEEALRIRRELGALQAEASSLSNLGNVLCESGDLEGARKHFEQVLAIFQGVGDLPNEGLALANLGYTYLRVGALEQARDLIERALARARLVRSRGREASALYRLSMVSFDSGDLAAARVQCEQALALCRERERSDESLYLTGLAFVLAELGEPEAATAAFEEALRLCREQGQEVLAVGNLAGLAAVAAGRGLCDEALAYAREALAWLAVHGGDGVPDPVRAYLTAADVLRTAGQNEEAAAALAAARALVEERAARISDPEMQASYLEKVPANARVLRETSRLDTSVPGG